MRSDLHCADRRIRLSARLANHNRQHAEHYAVGHHSPYTVNGCTIWRKISVFISYREVKTNKKIKRGRKECFKWLIKWHGKTELIANIKGGRQWRNMITNVYLHGVSWIHGLPSSVSQTQPSICLLLTAWELLNPLTPIFFSYNRH